MSPIKYLRIVSLLVLCVLAILMLAVSAAAVSPPIAPLRATLTSAAGELHHQLTAISVDMATSCAAGVLYDCQPLFQVTASTPAAIHIRVSTPTP